MDVERVWQRLRPMLAGRKVILTGNVLAAMQPLIEAVRRLGAQRPYLLAFGVGTGELPLEDAADRLVIEHQASDLLAEIRGMEATLREPPEPIEAALESYDPERNAVVLVGPFPTVRTLCGRRVLDGRLPAWAALEDKTRADELWDAAGVSRAPAAVVPAGSAELVAAARELDHGAGTVWAGDARDGFNGGGEFVRWVRSAEDAASATAFFATRCDRVRVMPFLDGIPCSVHGFVLPDGVAALRPVEMVVLRKPGSARFRYAGSSTWWDPPVADREVMRAAVRATGAELDRRVGYRGGFSVDGVLTVDGFRPTELNPRFTGGLSTIARALPEFPLQIVQAALVSGHDPGVSAAELEHTLVTAADRHRATGIHALVAAVRPTATQSRAIVFRDDACRWACDGEPPDGDLVLGPASTGGLLRLVLDEQRTQAGDSVAGRAVAAFALADREWGTGIGPCAAAPNLR